MDGYKDKNMSEIVIEHIAPPVDCERIYYILSKMDKHLVPILSERVELRSYAKKLALYADWYFVKSGTMDCGYCAIYMNRDSCAYISSFGIFPEYQQRGMGTKLLQLVMEDVYALKVKKIELEVFEKNDIACKLYKKMGFENIGINKNFVKMCCNIEYKEQSKIND